MLQTIVTTAYITGMAVTALTIIATEIDQPEHTPVLTNVLLTLLWPLFLIGLMADAYMGWRAQHRDHDPDSY